MSQALAAAIELAEQGYAVFPCRSADKRPATPHGFKDATSDPDDVRELWRRYPGGLVGVATGPASYIAVLDIDHYKHPEAWTWWAANHRRLLPTRVHRTRSGGFHCLFGDPDGIPCSESKVCRGVDTRGRGGYIIWWPAAGQPVLSDAPIAPWPVEFLDELLHSQPAPASFPRNAFEAFGAARGKVQVGNTHLNAARAVGLVQFVARAAEGKRNCILHWAACRAADMITSRELDRNAGVRLLEALHRAALAAGLEPREIRSTIHSALRGPA